MKRSTLIAIIVIAVVLLGILGLVLFLNRSRNTPASTSGPVTPQTQGPVGIADMAKPKLISEVFKGCPAGGDGGDPALNTLKNRVDEAPWQETTVASIVGLQWPHTIERLPRSRWSKFDTAEIARYEGAPVQVIGYLADAKKQSPETCNCHSVDYVDYHIWMVDDPSKDRSQSIVVESTPRVRQFHSGWTLAALGRIVKAQQKVRISGWLMLDPEHPDQVGKTRGTIWEIHPIMQIETLEGNTWKPLDNGSTGFSSTPAQPINPQAQVTAPPITPGPTAAPPKPGTAGVQYNGAVQITAVNADGKKTREPDEYVEIANKGTQPVDITGWVLMDPAGDNEYKWENYTIPAGQSIRVYTNEVHNDTGGFTFGSGSPVWANTGGVAELYDADKELVSRFLYGKQK